MLALGCALTATIVLAPVSANAAEPTTLAPPDGDRSDGDRSEGAARVAASVLALPSASLASVSLTRPSLRAIQPAPAMLIGPPIHAKRKRERSFDTSSGEVDPRKRQLPKTHRFRLALHAQWVRLTQSIDKSGELQRFHFAPLLVDLGYQAQFLKLMMVRLAVAAGGNVANTRHAMPVVLFPQAYVGLQTKVIGIAFGYGFDWTIPPTFKAIDPGLSSAIEQPVITRNHVVMAEVSATSRIDRVAMTFAVNLGGVQSDLSHFQTQNRKFRFYLGLQVGMFFDGTRRKEKKARKQAEAEGR